MFAELACNCPLDEMLSIKLCFNSTWQALSAAETNSALPLPFDNGNDLSGFTFDGIDATYPRFSLKPISSVLEFGGNWRRLTYDISLAVSFFPE